MLCTVLAFNENFFPGVETNNNIHMSHSQMLGNVESGGGPIFKVVLEC